MQTVYVPVSVDDELPQVNQTNLIIQATHLLSNVDDFQLREAAFKSDYMDNSNPEFSVGKRKGQVLYASDKVTHWLKSTEAVLLTKEDAEKIKDTEKRLTERLAWCDRKIALLMSALHENNIPEPMLKD